MSIEETTVTEAIIRTYTERFLECLELDVAIVGDIAHSRVARSNIIGLTKMGARVTVSGPPTMMPYQVHSLGVDVVTDPAEAVKGKDVIMVLRIQLERQSKVLFPSVREYASFFGINRDMMRKTKKDVMIMHPGPMNRGVEIDSDLADDINRSVIREQVEMGVAVRMACLEALTADPLRGRRR